MRRRLGATRQAVHARWLQCVGTPLSQNACPMLLNCPHLCPAEDEGAVLAVVVEADGGSSLVCLDGATLQEQARARLPWPITIGFHGCFVPAA